MNRFLNTEEVADFLGVSTKTIQNLINSGELAAIKVGRNWRIDPIQLQHYIHNAGTDTYRSMVERGVKLEDKWQA